MIAEQRIYRTRQGGYALEGSPDAHSLVYPKGATIDKADEAAVTALINIVAALEGARQSIATAPANKQIKGKTKESPR